MEVQQWPRVLVEMIGKRVVHAWVVYIILLFACAQKSADHHHANDSNDRIDSYNAQLLQAHAARVALDTHRANNKFPLTKRQKYLSAVVEKARSDASKFAWPYEHIEDICRRTHRSCSWDDALFLFGLLSEVNYSGAEVLSAEEKWLKPTQHLQKHKHEKEKSTCVRLKSLPTAAEFLYYYVSRSVPFVVEGGVAKWGATRKWHNSTYLIEMLRNERVRVYASLDGDFEKVQRRSEAMRLLSDYGIKYEDQDGAEEEMLLIRPAETEMSFEQYMFLSSSRYVNSERAAFYLQKHDMRQWSHVPNITTDLLPDTFAFAKMLSLEHFLLWMARGKKTKRMLARGPIHYDAQENLHATLSGSKHYLLYHPTESTALYESSASYRTLHLLYRPPSSSPPDDDEDGTKVASEAGRFFTLPLSRSQRTIQPFSPVNITHPNLDAHPLFATAKPLSCTVNAGDLIYIPSYHWHEVTSFPPVARGHDIDVSTIGVNMFFRPWWMKASDLQHFALNPLYSHLHSAVYDNRVGDDTTVLKRIERELRASRWKQRKNERNHINKKGKRKESRSNDPGAVSKKYRREL